MSLYLLRVDSETFLVEIDPDPDTPGAEDAVVLHEGEAWEGIPYEVWIRFVGQRIRLDLAQAEAEADRAEGVLDSGPDPGTDIPDEIRHFERCPRCGLLLEPATLELPSSSIAQRFLLGSTAPEDLIPLRLTLADETRDLMWTGQQVQARCCRPCRLILFRA